MDDLVGRTAVVTGGGSGIGRAIVLELAGAGMNVVIADIEDEAARSVASEAEGRRCARDRGACRRVGLRVGASTRRRRVRRVRRRARAVQQRRCPHLRRHAEAEDRRLELAPRRERLRRAQRDLRVPAADARVGRARSHREHRVDRRALRSRRVRRVQVGDPEHHRDTARRPRGHTDRRVVPVPGHAQHQDRRRATQPSGEHGRRRRTSRSVPSRCRSVSTPRTAGAACTRRS